MKRLWEGMATIAVTMVIALFALKLLYDLIKPLFIWIVVAAFVAIIASRAIKRWQQY